jgi:hypothetical protein
MRTCIVGDVCASFLGKYKKCLCWNIGGNHQKILNLLGKIKCFIVAPLLGMVKTVTVDLLY